MTTTQEEADTIIIQQLSHLPEGTVVVVADDTDIFLLLLHFSYTEDITCKVFMKATIVRSEIDAHTQRLISLHLGHLWCSSFDTCLVLCYTLRKF